jgi:hypothetical protein
MERNPKRKFFRNKSERDLWIRLNAERIQYSDKMRKCEEQPFGSVSEPHSYMWISKNQLDYDELMCKAPRYYFEELLMTREELFQLENEREKEERKKIKEESSTDEDTGGWNWR